MFCRFAYSSQYGQRGEEVRKTERQRGVGGCCALSSPTDSQVDGDHSSMLRD